MFGYRGLHIQFSLRVVLLLGVSLLVNLHSDTVLAQSPFGYGSVEHQPTQRVQTWYSKHQARPARTKKKAVRRNVKRSIPRARYYKGGSVSNGTISVVHGTFVPMMPIRSRRQREAYRSVCVRLKDGYFWPLSFASKVKRLGDDEALCQASCSSKVKLYFYANPGETIDDMRDLDGNFYRDLDTAYLFRTKYVPEAQCRPQPWSRESRHLHASLEQTEREVKLLNKLEENLAKSIDIENAKLDLNSAPRRALTKKASQDNKANSIKVNMVLLSALRATAIQGTGEGDALLGDEWVEVKTARVKPRARRNHHRRRRAKRKQRDVVIYEEYHEKPSVSRTKRRKKRTSQYALGAKPIYQNVKPRKKKKKWYKSIFKGFKNKAPNRGKKSPFFSF